MKGKIILVVGLALALVGCGRRQDSSAVGAVYKAQSYTVGTKTTTLKATSNLTMTLSLASDHKLGMLQSSTATGGQYLEHSELLTVAKQELRRTGEVTTVQYATASDLAHGINAAAYSYSQEGQRGKLGRITTTTAGLDLKLGRTTWHLRRIHKKTRFTLPYGIADQAKEIGVQALK
ncbi:hypothetical protein [Lacticaseibacillus parakribbianus]|uniref:hypothetical protein n=1 Tax=Lacticaseibacillus parakribbianus TaxID=2970927 RepID=UPI0021CB14D9|nr:hypothetical protein [Lacticaseibacillus parakribbianus]